MPAAEPLRVCRRFQLLRGWSDDDEEDSGELLAGGARAAVRLVLEGGGEHLTQWAAITSVASKIGCTSETLRNWVRQAERDGGQRPGPTTAERERIKVLEREVRQANEILRKASAHFAQAELDRPFKR